MGKALESEPKQKAAWPPAGHRKRVPVGKQAGQSFGSIAREAKMDVWDLIEFNFQTRNPREINWYLRNYLGCKQTTADGKNYVFRGASKPRAAIYLPSTARFPIAEWSNEKKLEEALRRSLKLLPAETAEILEKMLTPEALAIMGGITAVWAASHFVGIGEAIDVVLLLVGVATLSVIGWDAVEELQYFVHEGHAAVTEKDLDRSAEHFARAVSMLGVQAIMAILFKAKPRSFHQRYNNMRPLTNADVANAPRSAGKLLYKPTATPKGHKAAGTGGTKIWGDYWYSTQGTATDQKLARIHEMMHSFLTPRLQVFRGIRVKAKMNGYIQSHLLRALEEALVETAARLAAEGARGAFAGLSFPVKNGYVTVAQLGSETAGILMGSMNVGGMTYHAFYSTNKPMPPQ